MLKREDYLLGTFSGLLTGLFIISILLFFFKFSFRFEWLLIIIGFPLLMLVGLGFSEFLARFVKPFFRQFGKFAAVGFLSASIDFFILNLMSYLTGITAGIVVGSINVPGFIIATFNGYLWNKLWVFRHEGEFLNRLSKYFLVTTIGLFLNSLIVIVLTTYIDLLPYSPDLLNLNAAKVIATIVSLLWNFNGYKFFAFFKASNPL